MFIKTTLYDFLNENVKILLTNLDYNYKFDKSNLDIFIKSARKWNEKDFIEEYVYLNDIEVINRDNHKINKGDEVNLVRIVRNDKGETVYKDSIRSHAPYKIVTAEKDYGGDEWDFILDNTKELQDEAKQLYKDNKTNPKPKFKTKNIIVGYHASPFKFEQFRYGENNSSGQLGADSGFFFFKDLNNVNYYAEVLKENTGKSYIYKCNINLGNSITEKGENIGNLWGRVGWLEQASAEDYDTVIIEDADTGYGITDEIVVFDDDNIEIINVTEL